MNCFEFRRWLGIDPQSGKADFLLHRESCASCANAALRAGQMELRLQRAIRVTPPVGLADRIILAQTTVSRGDSRARHRRTAGFLAIAASIVVAFVLVQRVGQRSMLLSELVAEHVLQHESYAIDRRDPIPAKAVLEAFADRGVSLREVPAGISYVRDCPVGPYASVHMVMPAPNGPVSVVYISDPPARLRKQFEADGLQGREVPAGAGALILLASNDRDFDALERAWSKTLNSGLARSSAPVASAAQLDSHVAADLRPSVATAAAP